MAAGIVVAQPVRAFRPEPAVLSKAAQTQVTLRAGQFWRTEDNLCWRAILCREGMLWITQDGDLRDHLIKAGEMFLVSQPGKVITQALVNARIEVTPCLATAGCEGGVGEMVFP